ncbi:hypothetical protein A3762_12110 [Oleiphilus sp. HI0125]|uniref:DUF2288 domain-containing protein n=1 Tax=Oleiphilus sp. HI0125 TaxID=1822266 RepID=UPI0007C366F5|nr:DUF2288 domain-containing protein [Oleiphilus sp. HI0125]KZZ55299.1 hypothetical protein A3762_12110 [Oleiphilus sp. HI0125]
MTDQQKVPLAQKLNLETAQISWKELEPYFAGGKLISVSSDLDMLIVAEQIVADNAPVMKGWMAEEKVGQVSDEQAMRWSTDNTLLWAVVIKPWILVQERSTH